jgi:hypothetical protein
MGLDLGTSLAAMGTVWVGNPLSLNPGFSIGGPAESSSNILGNVLGLIGKRLWLPEENSFLKLIILHRHSARAHRLSQLDRSRLIQHAE